MAAIFLRRSIDTDLETANGNADTQELCTSELYQRRREVLTAGRLALRGTTKGVTTGRTSRRTRVFHNGPGDIRSRAERAFTVYARALTKTEADLEQFDYLLLSETEINLNTFPTDAEPSTVTTS